MAKQSKPFLINMKKMLHAFEGISVIVNSTSDEDKFVHVRNQFFQALYDNITQRFPCDLFLNDASVLHKLTWPTDPLIGARFMWRPVGC